MLPTYHHGGNMSGHGSKPLRRPWVPDLSGTLIAIIVLAVVLAFEHFHFQSRLARVSTLEMSLAKQLQELQGSLTQQDEQLHRMNPKLDEIDVAESSLKRLQEEVRRSSTGLQDVKTVLDQLQRTALDQLQTANATAELKEAMSLHGKQLEGLTAQLEAVRAAQAASNASIAALDSRAAELEANLTKLAAKLDSHNSALKTLADQLSVHQNSTLSALQEQTAAVSEALEAHRELQNSVEKLKELRTGAAGAGAAATTGAPGMSAAAGTNQSSAVGNVTSNIVGDDAASGTVAAANSMEAAIRAAISEEAADGASAGAARANTSSVAAAVNGTSASTSGAGVEDDHLTRVRKGLVLDDEEGSGTTTAAGSTSTTNVTSTTNFTSTNVTSTTTANATVANTTTGNLGAGNSSDYGAAADADAASTGQAAAGNGTGDSTTALEALRALVASREEEEGDATDTDSTALASITRTSGGAGDGTSTGGDDAVARMRGEGGHNQHQGFQAGAGRGRFERMHLQFTKQQQQATGVADADGSADAATASAMGKAVGNDDEGALMDEEEQDVVEGLRR